MTNNKVRNQMLDKAVEFLKSIGVKNPTKKQSEALVDKWLEEKKLETEKKRKIKAAQKAKREEEWENAPTHLRVKFEDGSEIICESGIETKKNYLRILEKEAKQLMGGRTVKNVDYVTRYKLGDVAVRASAQKLAKRLAEILGVSEEWLRQTALLRKCINFVENLKEVIAYAEEQKFRLTWYHILAAVSTKDNDRCCDWLKIAIYNRYSAKELTRKIANRAESVVRGKTEQECYIAEVAENEDVKKCLKTKGRKAITMEEPLRGNMNQEEFLTKLFTVVDVAYFL